MFGGGSSKTSVANQNHTNFNNTSDIDFNIETESLARAFNGIRKGIENSFSKFMGLEILKEKGEIALKAAQAEEKREIVDDVIFFGKVIAFLSVFFFGYKSIFGGK